MAEDVDFQSEDLGSYTVVRAIGYLDFSTSPRLREKLHQVIETAPRVILLDLGQIEFLDSSALGVILNAWKQMQADDATLALLSPQPRITKIFEITALNLSIRIFSSLDEARAELGLAG
ncbi:MAG TPA: STAS domain-containing protein [Acidimicrobiales bacterium]|nr:STAS domain-containing protein [Acidimicrobiales bacterium]